MWWWLKALGTLWLVCVAGSLLAGRYSLEIDPQLHQCLPGHRVFLLDRVAHDARRGDVILFHASAQQRLWEPGRPIGKLVAGVAGDRVQVGEDVTTVNGVVVGRGLAVAEKLGVTPASLARSWIVPDGEVWLMGATGDSYDSRYYGPVPLYRMAGVVYPIW